MPTGVTPLDTAVHNAAGRRIRARDVLRDDWVRSAVGRLRDGLESTGLAVGSAHRRALRLWVLPVGLLVAVGAARLVAGFGAGRPVGFLLPVVFAALLGAVVVLRRPAVATRAARTGLAGLRRRHDHLSPRHSPAYATYGAAGAAMGVALFGAASLYTMDPAFAAEAEVRWAATDSSGSGGGGASDGGGASGGGGSSDGGGSSGGGGSSCGGGCGG